jgi:hypothetical protein
MVSRTRLALIFLVLAGCILALSQPARILYRYDLPLPPEISGDSVIVRLNIEVLADTTVGEVSLQDNPSDLDSLAIDAARRFVYYPAFEDSIAITSTIPVDVIFRPKALPDYAIKDSTLTREYLEREVGKVIDRTRLEYRADRTQPPAFLFRENLHLYDLANARRVIVLDGLPIHSETVTGVHSLQSFGTFDDVSEDGLFVNANSREYTLAPAWCEARLGLGDANMNHAAVSFRKGSALAIPGLNIRFDYVGYDGLWPALREKSANFRTDVNYHFGAHTFRYDLRNVHQEIPAEAFQPVVNPGPSAVVKEDISRHVLQWDNPFVDVGGIYTIESYRLPAGKQEITRPGAYLQKVFGNDSTQVRGTWIITRQSEPEAMISTKLIRTGFEHGASLDVHGRDDAVFTTRNRFPLIGPFWGIADAELATGDTLQANTTRHMVNARLPLGLAWRSGVHSIELRTAPGSIFDTDHLSDSNDRYVSTDITARSSVTLLSTNLNAQAVAAHGGTMTITPNDGWRFDGTLWLDYDLHHDNFLELGGRILHFSGTPSDLDESNTNLDAWLGFEITRYFTIRAEAYNLLGEARFRDQPYSGTHYNFTVHWLFIN